MAFKAILGWYGETRRWALELGAAVTALLFGIALMPVLIFFAGLFLLGRYDGASLGRTYAGIFTGATHGSTASWIVILGPYGLYLMLRGLRAWWRASANLA
jgi:hypothetical protein